MKRQRKIQMVNGFFCTNSTEACDSADVWNVKADTTVTELTMERMTMYLSKNDHLPSGGRHSRHSLVQ